MQYKYIQPLPEIWKRDCTSCSGYNFQAYGIGRHVSDETDMEALRHRVVERHKPVVFDSLNAKRMRVVVAWLFCLLR